MSENTPDPQLVILKKMMRVMDLVEYVCARVTYVALAIGALIIMHQVLR